MDHLINALSSQPGAAAVLEDWDAAISAVIDEALSIQAIPAPTFAEEARAQHVAHRFRAAGMQEVGYDEMGSVYGLTPGADRSRPALLITAHLDTVFPQDTDLSVSRAADGRICGPGLGDNSLGLAALIQLAARIDASGYRPCGDLWWAATVCEEGLGNLRGIRQVLRRLGQYPRGRIGLALVLEGIGLGRVYHAGLGVRRLEVRVDAPGGHSWLHRDRPSAIHHLMLIGGALVAEMNTTADPASSFNIGLVSGGTSINTRAPQASIAVDLRAEDASLLARQESRLRSIVARFASVPEVAVSIHELGSRPSARLSPEHPLVAAARAVLCRIGFESPTAEMGSTDANILLAAHIPAICIGITSGGGAHTRNEYIDAGPIGKGMAQLALLALLADAQAGAWRRWSGS
jgi:acetylornithine deacetylase/succinyl-diaminopimelate desuccinylase-like protein